MSAITLALKGRRRAVREAGRAGPLAMVVLLAGAGAARAQRAAVLPEPGAPIVALAVDLNAGGIWDPAPRAGVSRLAAEAIVGTLRPTLVPLGAIARVGCDRFGLRMTLIAPASSWRAAAGVFLDALLHPTVDAAALDTARAAILQSLHFQEGNPASEIRGTAHEALFGPDHRWARGMCGSPVTLEPATLEDVQTAATSRFRPERAAAALAGPVDPGEARALLQTHLGDTELPILLPRPDPPPSAGRRELGTPTISSWISVAYPLDTEVDDEAVRMLAHRVLEDLRPAPERPDVVDADADVERFGGGGALVFYLATEPAGARAWIGRVQERVAAAAEEPMDSTQFALLLRRYRGARLLSLEAPEERAADAADRLFFDGTFIPPERRIEALTPERVRAAAAALGRPAVGYLGPDPIEAGPVDRSTGRP